MVAHTSDQAVGAQNTTPKSYEGITAAAASAHNPEGQKIYEAANAASSASYQEHVPSLQLTHELVHDKDGDADVWKDSSGNVMKTQQQNADGGTKTYDFKYDSAGRQMSSTLTERDKTGHLTYGASIETDPKTGQMKSDYHQFADGSFNSRHYDSQQGLVATMKGDAYGNTVKTTLNPKTGETTDTDRYSVSNGTHEHHHFQKGQLAYSQETDKNGRQLTRTYDPHTHNVTSSDTKHPDGSSEHMKINPLTDVVTNQTTLDKNGNGSQVVRDRSSGKVTSIVQIVHGKAVSQSKAH